MELEDFIGKYLLIYSVGSDVRYPTILSVDDVQLVSDRLFVVGRQPKQIIGVDNWLGNTDTHIAWDQVAQFHVFDSLESFEQAGMQKQENGLFNFFKR